MGAALMAVASLAVGFVACAPNPDAMVGKSAIRGAMSDEVPAEAGPDGAPLPIADQWRASTTRLGETRFRSRGHAGGRWEALARANGAAMDALDGGHGDFPVGARFIEEHFEKDAGGPLMLMEKRPPGFAPDGGDWRYAVLNAAGVVVSDGPIASCGECHGDAPRDHVFAIDAK